jgi:hypothetical protein
LRVAVRTEKAKIIPSVVEPVPVDVIHVQYYRLAVPLGLDPACHAGVRHATLAQCPPKMRDSGRREPEERTTRTCSGASRWAEGRLRK